MECHQMWGLACAALAAACAYVNGTGFAIVVGVTVLLLYVLPPLPLPECDDAKREGDGRWGSGGGISARRAAVEKEGEGKEEGEGGKSEGASKKKEELKATVDDKPKFANACFAKKKAGDTAAKPKAQGEGSRGGGGRGGGGRDGGAGSTQPFVGYDLSEKELPMPDDHTKLRFNQEKEGWTKLRAAMYYEMADARKKKDEQQQDAEVGFTAEWLVQRAEKEGGGK